MMSLLKDYAAPCVLMEKHRISDGEGGVITTEWTEGAEFTVYKYMDSSMEARIAEKQGMTSVYSGMVAKDFPLEHNDVFKDRKTGYTYRVTSDPNEKKAPESSTFDLKYFTAERWNLSR